jgi:tetratricopeptide (TPR) repeat protein
MRAVLYLGQALHGVGQHHAALKYLTEARQIHADINYHRELESLITSINAGLVSDAPSPEAESLTDHSESPDQTVVPALTPVPDDVYPSIDKSHAICIGPADRIALGYMEVNSGKYDAAIDSFSQLVQTDCETYLALCGRGSAFALKHDFDAAIADFTRAIEYDDSKADAYKRRGQVTHYG